MSSAAQRVFDEAKSTKDEFTGVDCTGLGITERRELAAEGVQICLDRKNRLIATYPASLRARDLREKVTSKRN